MDFFNSRLNFVQREKYLNRKDLNKVDSEEEQKEKETKLEAQKKEEQKQAESGKEQGKLIGSDLLAKYNEAGVIKTQREKSAAEEMLADVMKRAEAQGNKPVYEKAKDIAEVTEKNKDYGKTIELLKELSVELDKNGDEEAFNSTLKEIEITIEKAKELGIEELVEKAKSLHEVLQETKDPKGVRDTLKELNSILDKEKEIVINKNMEEIEPYLAKTTDRATELKNDEVLKELKNIKSVLQNNLNIKEIFEYLDKLNSLLDEADIRIAQKSAVNNTTGVDENAPVNGPMLAQSPDRVADVESSDPVDEPQRPNFPDKKVTIVQGEQRHITYEGTLEGWDNIQHADNHVSSDANNMQFAVHLAGMNIFQNDFNSQGHVAGVMNPGDGSDRFPSPGYYGIGLDDNLREIVVSNPTIENVNYSINNIEEVQLYGETRYNINYQFEYDMTFDYRIEENWKAGDTYTDENGNNWKYQSDGSWVYVAEEPAVEPQLANISTITDLVNELQNAEFGQQMLDDINDAYENGESASSFIDRIKNDGFEFEPSIESAITRVFSNRPAPDQAQAADIRIAQEFAVNNTTGVDGNAPVNEPVPTQSSARVADVESSDPVDEPQRPNFPDKKVTIVQGEQRHIKTAIGDRGGFWGHTDDDITQYANQYVNEKAHDLSYAAELAAKEIVRKDLNSPGRHFSNWQDNQGYYGNCHDDNGINVTVSNPIIENVSYSVDFIFPFQDFGYMDYYVSYTFEYDMTFDYRIEENWKAGDTYTDENGNNWEYQSDGSWVYVAEEPTVGQQFANISTVTDLVNELQNTGLSQQMLDSINDACENGESASAFIDRTKNDGFEFEPSIEAAITRVFSNRPAPEQAQMPEVEPEEMTPIAELLNDLQLLGFDNSALSIVSEYYERGLSANTVINRLEKDGTAVDETMAELIRNVFDESIGK